MSPVIKYDVSDVDESGGFEHVQPGMYIGEITEINAKDSKSGNGPMLEVILQPVKTADGKTVKPKDKKKQVARVYTYVLLEHEPSEWKLLEFIKAVGLKKKGSLNTDKLVGTKVQMNLKPDTDLEDHYRPRVGKLIAMPDGAGKSRVSEPEPESEEDMYSQDDLDDLGDDELLEVAEDEFGLPRPSGRMTPIKRKKLVRAILKAQEEEQEQEDEDEDSEEEDEEQDEETTDEEAQDEEDEDSEEENEDAEAEEDLEDTLGALDRTGLKAYIKDNDLEIKVFKSMEDDDIREAIIEASGSTEQEEEEAVDYNSWSMDALKKEAQERGLSMKGSKKILAGRLSKDDEDDDNPF